MSKMAMIDHLSNNWKFCHIHKGKANSTAANESFDSDSLGDNVSM